MMSARIASAVASIGGEASWETMPYKRVSKHDERKPPSSSTATPAENEKLKTESIGLGLHAAACLAQCASGCHCG